MNRFTVDQPTESEWVISDAQDLVHYYAALLPARLGRSAASQLIIAELGEYVGNKYIVAQEIYSNVFFSKEPRALAFAVINSFLGCRVHRAPVELVYEYGGKVFDDLHFYTHKEARQ